MLVSGRLVDWLGTRASLALFVGWWSLANIGTAFVRSFAGLGWCRLLLGIGEAGNWPTSAKVVSEWFPGKERGVAIGFYTMGATVGATIAPVLITHLLSYGTWRLAFMATGVLGLLWVVPWLMFYRRPQAHPWITAAELDLITEDGETVGQAPEQASEAQRWRLVLSDSNVWLMMIARMLTDPVWFFYQFWYSKYLFSVRGVGQKELGITWVVFLAADIGSFAGGFLSAYLIRRGRRAPASRVWAMLICAAVMPLAPLVASLPTVGGSLAIAMVIVAAHLAWLANLGALLVDLIPRPLVATAFGVVAAGSALGGIMMNKLVVYLIANYSYTPWFTITAFLHPVAWLILWVGRRRSDQVEMQPA
jgi:ACS family hexuronate transporter-like MFS transporter